MLRVKTGLIGLLLCFHFLPSLLYAVKLQSPPAVVLNKIEGPQQKLLITEDAPDLIEPEPLLAPSSSSTEVTMFSSLFGTLEDIPMLIKPQSKEVITLIFPEPQKLSELAVYDVDGVLVKRFEAGFIKRGRINWRIDSIKKGMYFLRAITNDNMLIRKITI
ncbi:MAG: T9SS type A sorting domain-containing protein [Fibrobacteria bacterium]|nr:T9SS type A sorting domain-containing protein [Fibrobacteria bacterium]